MREFSESVSNPLASAVPAFATKPSPQRELVDVTLVENFTV